MFLSFSLIRKELIFLHWKCLEKCINCQVSAWCSSFGIFQAEQGLESVVPLKRRQLTVALHWHSHRLFSVKIWDSLVLLFFYLWRLLSFRYRKCLVVAFEELECSRYLRSFIIPIHIAFSADSSFNKLLFIKMRIVTNKVGCKSPGAAGLSLPGFLLAMLHKTSAVLLSHL